MPVRGVLIAVAVVFVFAVGGGLYDFLGAPSLAMRTFSPPSDMPSLVGALARRAREKSFGATGFTLLGRGYLSLGDAGDAAAAFLRAAQTAPPQARPELLSAYGEALTMAASGRVTPDAENAFHSALEGNPHDFAAQYYLGLAYAARGDAPNALKLWKSLLADAPPGAPWRGPLLDRIVALQGQSGLVPDISAMVERLAARLKSSPNDPDGWLRLVRAYAVLGEQAKARTALEEGRAALQTNSRALGALNAEAIQLKLQ
jgi:cytochrome c-type biogenesis protein CcmH